MSSMKLGNRCSQAVRCEPHLMFALRGSLKLWSAAYCDGDFERCARYRLSLASRPVPDDLLPNGRVLNAVLI